MQFNSKYLNLLKYLYILYLGKINHMHRYSNKYNWQDNSGYVRDVGTEVDHVLNINQQWDKAAKKAMVA